MNNKRYDGRTFDQIRPVKIEFDSLGYADASVLLEIGNTKVLSSITLQQGVPSFLKGQKIGWLTAEYAMLPCATQQRTLRESNQAQRNTRNVEISRLIGRCLRSTMQLNLIGEKTIIIDCDVLQADGGTRVASITAASLALEIAAQRWFDNKILDLNVFKQPIAAISVGMVKNSALLDLSYTEDSQAEADFNFIMTTDGHIIEIQGTAEKIAVSWDNFILLKELACKGINQLFQELKTTPRENLKTNQQSKSNSIKPALFSLGNRLQKVV